MRTSYKRLRHTNVRHGAAGQHGAASRSRGTYGHSSAPIALRDHTKSLCPRARVGQCRVFICDLRLASACSGMDLGHLKIAWPVSSVTFGSVRASFAISLVVSDFPRSGVEGHSQHATTKAAALYKSDLRTTRSHIY
eukprot:5715005-Pleurochrysis_carterae.AAC.3